jgi:hypothetical protein
MRPVLVVSGLEDAGIEPLVGEHFYTLEPSGFLL